MRHPNTLFYQISKLQQQPPSLNYKNQVLQKFLKGIFFFPLLFNRGTTYEVMLKDSERYIAGYQKRSSYNVWGTSVDVVGMQFTF